MDAKTAKLDLGSVHSDLMQAGQGAGQGAGRTVRACVVCVPNGWHEPQCLDSRLLRNNEKEKRYSLPSGAAERGFGQSVLGVWGDRGCVGRRRGTVRFASRTVVPRCRVTVLGPLDSAGRMLPVKYGGSDDEEMGRTRFGLVGGKQGLREGDEGGGAWCVVL